MPLICCSQFPRSFCTVNFGMACVGTRVTKKFLTEDKHTICFIFHDSQIPRSVEQPSMILAMTDLPHSSRGLRFHHHNVLLLHSDTRLLRLDLLYWRTMAFRSSLSHCMNRTSTSTRTVSAAFASICLPCFFKAGTDLTIREGMTPETYASKASLIERILNHEEFPPNKAE